MSNGVQRLNGTFPGGPVNAPYSLTDVINNASGWSTGDQNLLPVSSQPTITRPWTILGWSITFSGFLLSLSTGVIAGRLGKLYGGLIFGGSVAPQIGSFLASSLPADPTTIGLLWDGLAEETFPWTPNSTDQSGAPNVTTVSQQLPVALPMAPSDKLGMGLWLTPSLGAPVNDGGHWAIGITASYSIEYLS